jgi:hypothetical protein
MSKPARPVTGAVGFVRRFTQICADFFSGIAVPNSDQIGANLRNLRIDP